MKTFLLLIAIILQTINAKADECYLWLTDGNGDNLSRTITVYPGYNQGIYITGCTYTDPFSAGKIYIVNNLGFDEAGLNNFQLFDVGGNPNVINSFITCGYVEDELIGSTNNLPLGEFDIILDRNLNGFFDVGIDCILGGGSGFAFKLIAFSPVNHNSPLPIGLLTSANNLVNENKQDAAKTRDKLKDIYAAYKTSRNAIALFDAFRSLGSLAVGTIVNAGLGSKLSLALKGYGIIGKFKKVGSPSDDFYENHPDALSVKSAADLAATAAIARYDAIANDPPRFDYTVLAIPDSIDQAFLGEYNDTVNYFFARLHSLLQFEESVLRAETKTLERFQGAVLDSNKTGCYLQLINLVHLKRIREQIFNHKLNNWQFFRSALIAKGITGLIPVDDLKDIQTDIMTNGFGANTKLGFESASLTADEINSIRDQIISTNYDQFSGKTHIELIDEQIQVETTIRDSLSISIDSTLSLANQFAILLGVTTLPDFDITAPLSAVGRKNTTAGALVTFQYHDINQTGTAISKTQFFNYRKNQTVTATSHTYNPLDPGFDLVSCTITLANGLTATAYHLVEITPGLSSPKILLVTPDTTFIETVSKDSALVFKVKSVSIPAGFTPVYNWYVNDFLYATGADSMQLTMLNCTNTVFNVKVILSDNALGNFNDVREWQVKVIGDPALCNNRPHRKTATNWYFGTNAGMRFTDKSPVALLDGQLITGEGACTMSDSAGNLLYYSDGITVWNRVHTVMPNGTGLLGESSSTQGAVTVPYPGQPDKYFLFTIYAAGTESPGPFAYNIIDMKQDGGKGAIVLKNQVLLNPVNSEKIAATYHQNQRHIWVVTYDRTTKRFFSYLINENGINRTPVISQITDPNLNPRAQGYMRISPNGKILATADMSLPGGSTNYFHYFDFNTTTGIVSNGVVIHLNISGWAMGRGIYGVEFSPNSRFLYVSDFRGSNRIGQFDLSLSDPAAILSSVKLTAATGTSDNLGALQLGPDGKIYVARSGSNFLGVIHEPNNLAPATNYVVNGFFLNRTSALGIPGFISSIFISNQIQFEGKCASFPTNFKLDFDDSTKIKSVKWNFGDGDTSLVTVAVSHIYTNPGKYNVTAAVTYDTTVVITDTLTTEVEIEVYPGDTIAIMYFGNDTVCVNDTAYLCASRFADSYQWYKDGTPYSNKMDAKAFTDGNYSLISNYVNACTAKSEDDLQLTFSGTIVQPTINFSNDSLRNTESYSQYQWLKGGQPIQDATDATFKPTSNGDYQLQVTNRFGCVGLSNIIPVIFTGIIEADHHPMMTVYPNPATNEASIVFHHATAANYKLQVTDLTGRVLTKVEQLSATGENKVQINLHHYSPGIYFVTLISDMEAPQTIKFVKE